ncbi:MAG: type 4b pilus protein PilO2 [Rickettsiales bacterium]|nr:type 4b pilus protein PilO2 [Rickettsiales bacterium]
MAGGVITVSRRKYAVGLFWQPSPDRGNLRENALKIARTAHVRASLFVAFNGMIGLSNRVIGARNGMPAAAPEVIEAFGENTFLSVFSVSGGFWLLAVRGGIIVRDKFFSDFDLAKQEYLELNAMPDWTVLVAPADWNAAGAVERRLGDIMSGNKKYYLANISHLPGTIATLALLACALFGGYKFFERPIKKLLAPQPQQLNIDPKIAEEYKRKLETIDAPPPKEPPKKIHVPLPYEALPDVNAKADQCWRAIAFLSQQIVGWVVDSVSCTDGEANAHLLRSYGIIGDLYDEVRKKMPGVKIDETGGNDVILSAKLKYLDTSVRAPLHAADEIMTAVQSVFQRLDEDVEFRRDFAELQIPELGGNEILDTDMTDVPIVKIEAASKMQPREFIKIINDVGPVRMPMIKWDNKSRTWHYDVVIYVK